MKLNRALLIAALICSTAGAAMAEEVVVPSGRATPVMQFSSIDSGCNAIGRPKPNVMRKPQHGTVTFKWGRGTLSENARSCAGKTTLVTYVIYTSDKGYHGPDAFKVGMSVSKFDNDSGLDFMSESYDVMVK